MKHVWAAALFSASVLVAPNLGIAQTDEDIRQRIIESSIASYSGNCPCPYNRASNGSRCGGRSAYSRPGGASPLCYESDISAAMVERYRQQHGLPVPVTVDRETVREIQAFLEERGFDPGPVDGLMGPKTRAAIAEFQRMNGMPATGAPSHGLLSALPN